MSTEPSEATFRVTETGDQVSIEVGGVIDEASVFQPPPVRGRRVVIDAHGVERINSMGVRVWILLMKEIGEAASEIVIQRLPPALVTQASMISSFLGRAQVESFLSLWVCPHCDHSTQQQHAYTDPLPQSIPCPQCANAMELDMDREEIVAFRGT